MTPASRDRIRRWAEACWAIMDLPEALEVRALWALGTAGAGVA